MEYVLISARYMEPEDTWEHYGKSLSKVLNVEYKLNPEIECKEVFIKLDTIYELETLAKLTKHALKFPHVREGHPNDAQIWILDDYME